MNSLPQAQPIPSIASAGEELKLSVATVLFRTSRGLSRGVGSASGQIVKLEAWHFKAAPVR